MAKYKENQTVIQPEHKDGCQPTVRHTKMYEAFIVVNLLPLMSYNVWTVNLHRFSKTIVVISKK